MSNSKLKFAMIVAMGLASHGATALAGDAYYITPGVGTLGVSVKGGYRWSQDMGVSGIVSGFSYSRNVTYAGVPGTAKTSLFDMGMILDYYPMGGDLRVSGGVRYSQDKVTGNVSDSGTTVGYTLKANSLQPYLGVGYSLPVGDRMAVDLDLGAYYRGTTTVTTNSSFSNSNIDAALNKAKSDANDYPVYPVAQIGLRFEF